MGGVGDPGGPQIVLCAFVTNFLNEHCLKLKEQEIEVLVYCLHLQK